MGLGLGLGFGVGVTVRFGFGFARTATAVTSSAMSLAFFAAATIVLATTWLGSGLESVSGFGPSAVHGIRDRVVHMACACIYICGRQHRPPPRPTGPHTH